MLTQLISPNFLGLQPGAELAAVPCRDPSQQHPWGNVHARVSREVPEVGASYHTISPRRLGA